MQYSIKYASIENQRTDCLVVSIYAGKKLSVAASHIDNNYDQCISKTLKLGDFTGAIGETAVISQLNAKKVAPFKRLVLLGCGSEKKLDLAAFIKANQALGNTLSKLNCAAAISYHADFSAEQLSNIAIDKLLAAAVPALDSAFYSYDEYKEKKTTFKCKKISFAFQNKGTASLVKKRSQGIKQGSAVAIGIAKTKDLGNAPGNLCTPSFLAKEAKELKKDYRKLVVSVLEEKDLAKLGMHSFLSVSKGSKEPVKLIVMQYMQGKKGKKPAVLVGKGITFDTGGISLKPGAQMDEMKYDMCGAASVIGTMQAVAEMQLPINLVGIIAAAENMPDGQASKPGDIVTSMSGQTIEILNTDAEGRLVLCDALTYAEKFDPAAVIDIATLTGACIIALGRVPSAMYSNKEKLAQDLTKAGQDSHDRVWQMPLWDDYQSQLDSNFADMANIGGRDAGSVTAACFLARFTKKYPWAHLDIAGTAWVSGAAKGATGRPVPLLIQYLIDNHC